VLHEACTLCIIPLWLGDSVIIYLTFDPLHPPYHHLKHPPPTELRTVPFLWAQRAEFKRPEQCHDGLNLRINKESCVAKRPFVLLPEKAGPEEQGLREKVRSLSVYRLGFPNMWFESPRGSYHLHVGP